MITERNIEIAQTILNQLGGKRFTLMTGAKDLVAADNYLMFKIMRNSSKITHVKIDLNGKDLYNITFFKWNGKKMEYSTVKELNDVYCEDLKRLFTETTGLYTSL